mgnify:CR=1 FL=1
MNTKQDIFDLSIKIQTLINEFTKKHNGKIEIYVENIDVTNATDEECCFIPVVKVNHIRVNK